MVILCFYCNYEWISNVISRCPNCNSGNVGPHPSHYKIKKINEKKDKN